MQSHNKLAPKPKWLNINKITRASYQNRAYNFNTLSKCVTAQMDFFVKKSRTL